MGVMKVLRYDESVGPKEWGRAHGERFRDDIRAIADIRLDLTVELGRLPDAGEVLGAAEAHLSVLERADRPLYDELVGTAEGADVDPARVVVLNHYTDLRDLAPGWEPPPAQADTGCTVIYRRTPEGPVLAQTWDIHGSAMPYVCMLYAPPHEGPGGPAAPDAWVLSITGCLGMCGMNRRGVSVAINNTWSLDARVGLVWSALVRQVLRTASAEEARDLILDAQVGSGHHYFVSDGSGAAFGIETSGRRKRVVYDAAKGPDHFVHTNHCYDEHIAEVTTVSSYSTTYERFERMNATFDEALPDSVAGMWAAFGTDRSSPNSVCMAGDFEKKGPHAVATCAIALMDPTRLEVWGQQGSGPEVSPQRFTFSD